MKDILLVQGTKAVIIQKDGRVQIGTQRETLMANVALAQLTLLVILATAWGAACTAIVRAVTRYQ